MIRATFAASLAGITLGITAGIASFIPAIYALTPTEREWVRAVPRRRR